MKIINTSQFPVLKTKRTILRQLINDDAQAISDLRNDESVNMYIDRPKVCSIDIALDFISRRNDDFKNKNWLYWAICLKDNPKLIGTFGLWNFTDDMTAEVGYELSLDYQGQGLMNEVIENIIKFSFKTLSLKKLEADVRKDNERSINLLIKNKFTYSGQTDTNNPNYHIYSISNK